MPELPEVETIRRTRIHLIKDRTITGVKIFYDPIVEGDSNVLVEALDHVRIEEILRQGKYLIFLVGTYALLVHLRMEGRFFIREVERESKHDHVSFALDDGRFLVYHDTRKFGRIMLRNRADYVHVPPLSALGPEPQDANLEDLYHQLKRRKIAIKTALLDQHMIAGLGNIYVDETLFSSRIHPEKRTDTLTKENVKTIILAASTILEHATRLGGTSIRTYTDALGVHGRFQNELHVHTKEHEPCPICNTIITKQTLGGRGTYVCPTCQKK